MTDLASLSFNVDSGPAAANFLQLANAAQNANLSVSQFMAGIMGGQTQLSSLAASLEGVVRVMQQARTAMDGSSQSFEVFSRARNEAQLLGNVLGTTALGLESFSRQASQLGLNAQQIATSLQRVTQALEGQTAAARQLRSIMQDYGVSLEGITASNADQVLLRFAERVRGFQMTPGQIQNIQQVMGPLDPAALGQLTNQPTPTSEATATRLKIEQVNRDAAATTDAAAAAYAQLRQGFEALKTLGVDTYNTARLTPVQMEQLNQGAGLVGAPESQATQLRRLRYLDTQAPQELRDAASNREAARGSWWPQSQGPAYREGLIAEMNANNLNIEARRSEDQMTGTGFGASWLGSGIMRDLRRLQNNLWGGYTPTTIDSGPTLPVDPNTLRDRRLALGGELAGYGAPDFMRQQGAAASVEALTRGAGVIARPAAPEPDPRISDLTGQLAATQGEIATLRSRQFRTAGTEEGVFRTLRDETYQGPTLQGEDLGRLDRARRRQADLQEELNQALDTQVRRQRAYDAGPPTPSDAERAFIQAYSVPGGPGATAGSQRFTNQLDIATRARDQALQPGAAQLNEIALQRFILSQPRDEQAQAQQLLTFAGQQGVSTGAIAGRGLSIQDLIAGRVTGPGALATDQAAAFRGITAGQNENFQAGTMQSLRQNLADEQALQAVIPQGTAVLAQRTAAQTAFNAARDAGLDKTSRSLAAFRAEQEAMERQNTEGLRLLDTLTKTNEAESRRQRAADQFGGGDPTDRLAASMSAVNETALEELRRTNPGQADAIMAQRRRQAGQAALAGGSDQLALAQTNVGDAQRTLEAAREGGALQQRLNSDLAVEQEFRQRIAQAKANAPDTVALLQAEQREIQRLRAEYDQTTAAIKNFEAANQTANTAALNAFRNTLSPPQQRAFDASRGTIERNINQPSGLSREAFLEAVAQRESGNQNITQRSGGPASGYWQMEDQTRPIPGASATWEQSARWAGLPERPGGGYGRAMDYTREEQHAAASALYDRRGEQPWAMSDPNRVRERARQMLSGGGTESERAAITADQLNRQELERGQDIDAQRAADVQRQRSRARLGAAGRGQFAEDVAGAGVQDPTQINAAADAQRRLNAVTDQYAERRTALIEGNRQEIDDAGRLLAATREGIGSKQDMIAQLRTEAQARATGLQGIDQETVRRQELTKELLALRQAYQDAAAARRNENELMQAGLDAGPLASPRSLGRARARVLVDQDVRSGAVPEEEREQALDDRMRNETLKQQTEDVNQLRQGFLQMEAAAMSSFETAVVGGAKLSTVLQSLVQDLARIALHTFVSRPIMNMFTELLSGIGGGLTGGGAGMGVAGPIGSGLLSGGLGLGGGAATGTVLSGRTMATGGLIDHPTRFLAAGGSVLAGESDTEAIMPLRRLPSGNLGVAATGGGGGGTSITVNAPITVGAGAAGKDGQLDPAAARAMQAQLQQVLTDAVRSTIVNEMRDGGDIRVHIGG